MENWAWEESLQCQGWARDTKEIGWGLEGSL